MTRVDRNDGAVSLGRPGLLLLLVLVLTLSGAGPVARAGPERSAPRAPTAWTAAMPGRYYLTPTTYRGNNALTACERGYHMASLGEILDPSNLVYDTTVGYTLTDSGQGPPTSLAGWVRTGTASSGVNTPGQGNCLAWTSSSAANYGTLVNLPLDWTAGTDIGPWDVTTGQCSSFHFVWCVRPPAHVYLPLILRNL